MQKKALVEVWFYKTLVMSDRASYGYQKYTHISHEFPIIWRTILIALIIQTPIVAFPVFRPPWYSNVFCVINTLRPRQNGRHFTDDIFKCIFLNENTCISLEISLKFVRKVQINNILALVQIMAWHRPGDKPLSEPMLVSLLTHICVTRPQWFKWIQQAVSN